MDTSRTPGSRGRCGADCETWACRSCAHTQQKAPGKRPGAQRNKNCLPDPQPPAQPTPATTTDTPGRGCGRDAEPLHPRPLPALLAPGHSSPVVAPPRTPQAGSQGPVCREKRQRAPLWLQGAGSASPRAAHLQGGEASSPGDCATQMARCPGPVGAGCPAHLPGMSLRRFWGSMTVPVMLVWRSSTKGLCLGHHLSNRKWTEALLLPAPCRPRHLGGPPTPAALERGSRWTARGLTPRGLTPAM